MSTNCDCEFVQWSEGEWYYILEDYNAPKNSWDWREFATCYGPFKTEEEAHQHLRDNHANPGGYTLNTRPDKEDKCLQKLIEAAPGATIREQRYPRWY